MEIKTVKVDKTKLEKVIKRLSNLTRTKVLPILCNFCIFIDNNQMEIRATNLQVFGSGKLECESTDKFSFCIDAVKLAAVVSIADGILNINYDEKKHSAVIKYGHSIHKFGTESAEDFVAEEKIEGKSLKEPNLVKIFKRSLHAVCTEELRANMAGIIISKDSIRATDGFRAILNYVKEGVETERGTIIVPREMTNTIAGLIESDIEIIYNETDIKVIAGEFEFQSKLIDDTPPQLENVIPAEFKCRYIMKTEEFKKALRSVMISAMEIIRKTKLSFGENNTLTISTDNSEIGAESTDQIGYELIVEDGQPTPDLPIEVAFNCDYLLDMLSIIETDTIELKSPVQGQAHIVTTEDFKYLVMPQRL